MTETTTGPKRIKGLLPADAVVAHKTGTSPTNSEGLSPATNDVGIITLPNGKHIAIAIFVCNSTADEAAPLGTGYRQNCESGMGCFMGGSEMRGV